MVRAQSDYCTEVILDLKSMIKEVLKNFYKTCGEKPERILFYQHGVSDGQMDRVLRDEVVAIKNACSSLEENYSPSLTLLSFERHVMFVFSLPILLEVSQLQALQIPPFLLSLTKKQTQLLSLLSV